MSLNFLVGVAIRYGIYNFTSQVYTDFKSFSGWQTPAMMLGFYISGKSAIGNRSTAS